MNQTNSVPAHSSKYRPDIDGLRALAVLVVVLYHAGFSFCGGGFVGVDVFFVISGFLITGLLYKEVLDRGKLSFMNFYARRMKRLLPAWVAVIIATVALNIFLVPGFIDARKFAASIRWSSFGLANVFFKRNTGGYFDGVTAEMPFLHFWSLGVEEQFYLIWPFLLSLCHFGFQKRRSKHTTLIVLVMLIGLSFWSASRAISSGRVSSAFYLMPLRAWELGIGALISFFPIQLINKKISLITSRVFGFAGLSLILFSVFTLSTASVFPGMAALPPVLGAALLIWAGSLDRGNLISSLLSFRPIVHIGVLSYGWYLWHWPLLVTARLWKLGEEPSSLVRVLMLALGLVLAEMSLRWIEKPIRQGDFLKKWSSNRVVWTGLCVNLVLLSFAYTVQKLENDSLARRMNPALVNELAKRSVLAGKCDQERDVGVGDCTVSFAKSTTAKPLVAVWGDSHACSYFAMLEKFGRENGINVTQYCQGQSPPIWGSHYADLVVEDLRKKVKALSPEPVSVVLASRWVSYTGRKMSPLDRADFPIFGSEAESLSSIKTRLAQSVEELRKAGIHRVLIVLPYVEFKYPLVRCLLRGRSCETKRAAMEEFRAKAISAIKEATARYSFVKWVDPLDVVCDRDVCPELWHGVPVVIDTNHPSFSAAQAIGARYSSEMRWLIRD